ncbi:MAG: O-antigen polymerase [Gemella sp.]|nr:O-antigen polymerase [Gemella sp.]
MAYVLFFMTLIFLFFNWIITKKDYLHPSNIIIAIALLYQTMILFSIDIFQIEIVEEVVYIFLIFLSVITGLTIISKLFYKRKYVFYEEELKEIVISKSVIWGIILLQLYYIYYSYKYISEVVIQVFGGYDDLSDMSDKYQHYAKFLDVTVTVGMDTIASFLSPIFIVISYYIIYIVVNNYIVTKRVNLLNLIIIGNLIFYYVLNGSRSPILRVITFVIFLYLFINIKSNKKFVNLTFGTVIKFLSWFAFIIIGSLLSVYVVGRDIDYEEFGLYRYIFMYTAAPIVNLSNYIRDIYTYNPDNYFGEQTLGGIYNYIAYMTGNLEYKVIPISEFLPFIRSDNNIGLGNVYTTFYMFMYDNGYLSVFVFSLIMFIYYIFSYSNISSKIKTSRISVEVFIYAYLFNDLVMLLFSNRFYETTATPDFVKFIIYSIIIAHFLNRADKNRG